MSRDSWVVAERVLEPIGSVNRGCGILHSSFCVAGLDCFKSSSSDIRQSQVDRTSCQSLGAETDHGYLRRGDRQSQSGSCQYFFFVSVIEPYPASSSL